MTSPEVAWFEDWFDRDYLRVYGHRDRRDARRGTECLRAVCAARGLAPKALLDLACGAGRHLGEMRSLAALAVGLDLSPTLLGEARSELGPDACLVRADMRKLPFRDQAFDIVTSFFTSFGYFDEAGNASVLAEVGRLLRPGGLLFLDYLNRDHALRHLEAETRRSLGSLFVLESRHFDSRSQRLEKRIEIQDGSATRHRRESVRLYPPGELVALLRRHGLRPAERFGDLSGEPFDDKTSPRLVVVAERT